MSQNVVAMDDGADPFNRDQAREHEEAIPILQRRYVTPTMDESAYYAEIQEENRTRRVTADPISGFSWILDVSWGRFSEERPYLELRGRLSDWYVTPESSMDTSNYPMHLMVPTGSTLLLEKMLRRANHQVTAQLEKMDATPSGDFSTTYRVTGGTLKALLNVLEQSGFPPPVGRTETRDGAPWHISM